MFIFRLILVMFLINSNLCRSEENDSLSTVTSGHWNKVDRSFATDPQMMEDLKKLEALGYLKGYTDAPEQQGVTLYNKDLAYHGYNLYYSGHTAEAFLMDMTGEILHQWKFSLDQVLPELPKPKNPLRGIGFWRRVYLYENGDLLAMYANIALVKIDKESKLLWMSKNQYHHDIILDDQGNIMTLDRKRILWICVKPF